MFENTGSLFACTTGHPLLNTVPQALFAIWISRQDSEIQNAGFYALVIYNNLDELCKYRHESMF